MRKNLQSTNAKPSSYQIKTQLADQAEDLAILKKLPPTSRRLKSKLIRIYARIPAPDSSKANEDGALCNAKWVIMPGENQAKNRVCACSNSTAARRIQFDLAEDRKCPDLKTIMNSMTRQKLMAKAARKFKTTTDSDHRLSVVPNLPKQNFNAAGPNQKWVGDIMYLMTSEDSYIWR